MHCLRQFFICRQDQVSLTIFRVGSRIAKTLKNPPDSVAGRTAAVRLKNLLLQKPARNEKAYCWWKKGSALVQAVLLPFDHYISLQGIVMKNALCALWLTLFATSPIIAQPVVITDLSNWDDVIDAVERANASEGGMIGLKSRAEILVEGPLPAIIGAIVIEGNGANLIPSATIEEPIIHVSQGSRLEIKDIFFSGFIRNRPDEDAKKFGMIDNEGHMILERVTLANNPSCVGCPYEFPLIHNRNHMQMNNVTLFENSAKNVAALENRGNLRITNSTFSRNRYLSYYCSLVPCVLLGQGTSISTSEDSSTSFGNVLLNDESVMAHLPSGCLIKGEVMDLGGNVFTDPNCSQTPDFRPSDSAHLGSFAYHGGLVPTVGLEPNSVAIDAGLDRNCTATDARFATRPVSGFIHSRPRCDAGSFEYGGGFGNSDLAAGGMNGMWFNFDADGHYLHIMRVSPDRIHVTWTAFNHKADQIWIYSVAESVGSKTLSATAYININGQLIPGSSPSGSHVEEWGEIEIEFENCMKGIFKYRANDPNFGSGEFQIDRLAFVEGGGCTE